MLDVEQCITAHGTNINSSNEMSSAIQTDSKTREYNATKLVQHLLTRLVRPRSHLAYGRKYYICAQSIT